MSERRTGRTRPEVHHDHRNVTAGRLRPAVFGAMDGLATLGALFGCGALVSRVTARSWWYSRRRQGALGAAAAAVTYGVGSVVGS